MKREVDRRKALARLGVRVLRIVEKIPEGATVCRHDYVTDIFRQAAIRRGAGFGGEYKEEADGILSLFPR